MSAAEVGGRREGKGTLGAFCGFFDCDAHAEVVGFVRGLG